MLLNKSLFYEHCEPFICNIFECKIFRKAERVAFRGIKKGFVINDGLSKQHTDDGAAVTFELGVL